MEGDIMEDSKDMISKEIKAIEKEFQDIRENFFERNESEEIVEDMEKLDFLEKKISILNIALLDEKNKSKCNNILANIRRFKGEERFKEQTEKIEILKLLQELTTSNIDYHPVEIIMGIDEILKVITITEDNILDIIDSNLVYYNKVDMNKDISDKSLELRKKESLNILENLFQIVHDSYKKDSKPLDIFEKIMLISILDGIKKNLS